MKTFLRYASVAALAMGLLVPAHAGEPGITRRQADEILSELKQIRQLLEQQSKLAQDAAARPQPAQDPGPQRVKLRLDAGPVLGSAKAPVTIVEFTDYQCPFCLRFHTATFPDLKKTYIDTGKVRFYSRDLPLEFHSNAERAAEAARCAGDQGQFWKMRDVLGSNPSKLAAEDIAGYVKDVNLDAATFQACMDLGKYKKAIESDSKQAMALGINGTPSFIVGRSSAEGVEGEVIVGAQPLAGFEEKIKALLEAN
jgi:protein-disulfide isomerase